MPNHPLLPRICRGHFAVLCSLALHLGLHTPLNAQFVAYGTSPPHPDPSSDTSMGNAYTYGSYGYEGGGTATGFNDEGVITSYSTTSVSYSQTLNQNTTLNESQHQSDTEDNINFAITQDEDNIFASGSLWDPKSYGLTRNSIGDGSIQDWSNQIGQDLGFLSPDSHNTGPQYGFKGLFQATFASDPLLLNQAISSLGGFPDMPFAYTISNNANYISSLPPQSGYRPSQILQNVPYALASSGGSLAIDYAGNPAPLTGGDSTFSGIIHFPGVTVSGTSVTPCMWAVSVPLTGASTVNSMLLASLSMLFSIYAFYRVSSAIQSIG